MSKFVYGILAVIVASVIAVCFYASSIITTAIEKVGSEAVGAPVTVDSVNLSLLSGEGSISGLKIANPAGFKTPNAVSLGEIYLNIEPKSLLGDVVHIKEVRITKPEVFYERNLKTDNFQTIQKNINSFVASKASSSSKPAAVEEKSATADSSSSKKVILDLFTMQEAKMDLVMATPAGDQKAQADLPKIVIKDIGKAKGGEEVANVVAQITAPVLQYVNSGAIGAFGDLKAGAIDKFKSNFEKSKDKALGKLKGLFGN